MPTDYRWEALTPFTDMQMFLGADSFRTTSGTTALTLNASGDMSLNVGNSQTTVNLVSGDLQNRTGQLATAALNQQQFGTAAGVPGPSSVAGTSDPLGLRPGFPPIPASQMATLGHTMTGATPKGFMITSIDVIYLVAGLALTTNSIGITACTFVNNVANSVTNILAKAANGLQTAIQANPYVTNIPIASPAFTVTSDTEIVFEWDVTTGATGTARLYGIVIHYTYNLA